MTTALAVPTGVPRETVLAPGLDPAAPYCSRLSARSALYSELHQLLGAGGDVLTVAGYRALVLEVNVLGRSSSAARNKLWQELKSRYRLDVEDPLFAVFWTEWIRCGSDPERGLTGYVLLALNDHFVADIGTAWLFCIATPRSSRHQSGGHLGFHQPSRSGTSRGAVMVQEHPPCCCAEVRREHPRLRASRRARRENRRSDRRSTQAQCAF